MRELGFVGGTATGHTDNEGEEAYNQKLTERRAQNRRVTIRRTDCGPAN